MFPSKFCDVYRNNYYPTASHLPDFLILVNNNSNAPRKSIADFNKRFYLNTKKYFELVILDSEVTPSSYYMRC